MRSGGCVRAAADRRRQRRHGVGRSVSPHDPRRLELGARHQPHRCVPHDEARGAPPRSERRRLDRGDLVDRRSVDTSLHDALQRVEGRPRDARTTGRRRVGLVGHPGERGASEPGADRHLRRTHRPARRSSTTTSTRCRSADSVRPTTSHHSCDSWPVPRVRGSPACASAPTAVTTFGAAPTSTV